jgi:hypothetical protein
VRRSVLALVTALLAVTSTIAVTAHTSEPAPVVIQSAPARPAPESSRERLPADTEPAPVPRAARAEQFVGVPYWVQRDIENQIALLVGAPSDVLFLGDSITELLARGDGKILWDILYRPLGALDFGIAAIRTSHVLWQVESGQVAMAAPKVVVLMIGTNNLTAGESPPEVAAGVEKIVNTITAQLPDTRILLLGILPRSVPADDTLPAKIAETNRLLAELDGDRVSYLDIGAWFLDPDGAVAPFLMPDGLHPSYWGYFVYTVVIWEQLMGLLAQE